MGSGEFNDEKAQLCGAPAAAASVLLQVHVSEQILAEVEKLIPEQIRCRPGDTAQSLQERIEECGWLDSGRVKKEGSASLPALVCSCLRSVQIKERLEAQQNFRLVGSGFRRRWSYGLASLAA